MSTHIYNAYKFNGDLDALIKHIKAYRVKWIDYQKDRIKNVIINGRHHAEVFNAISEDDILSFNKLREVIVRDSNKEYKSHGDIYDVTGSIVIYSHKKSLYVQTFLNDRLAPKFLTKKFTDYHYQDQADPWFDFQFADGKITKEERKAAQKEWKVRENTWKNIFNDWADSPAQCGMTFELCTGMDYYVIASEAARYCRGKFEPAKEYSSGESNPYFKEV